MDILKAHFNRSILKTLSEGLLCGYSQVFFVKSKWAGFLFLAATFIEPVKGLSGFVGLVLTNLFAFFLGMDRSFIKTGLFGLNGLLVGLALGSWYQPGWGLVFFLVMASLAAAVATGALYYFLGRMYNLPILSLPFVSVSVLIYLSGQNLSGLHSNLSTLTFWEPSGYLLPQWFLDYLKALAAIFFQTSLLSGAIILAALLFKSRIIVFLTFLGFFAERLFTLMLGVPGFSSQELGFNMILSAVSIGGIFFIPSPRAFLAGMLAAGFGAILTLGISSFFTPFTLPVLAWPFNLTVLSFILAGRARMTAAQPQLVDFIPDTPERNIDYHLTRLRRYPGLITPVFSPPVKGRWKISQGPQGGLTHQGLWSHAWDFMGEKHFGNPVAANGYSLQDDPAYGKPVVAAAPGKVVRVIDGIPDNPIGQENLKDRWGNLVMLEHTVGLYTLYCHLTPGSIGTKEKELVSKGQTLGRIGNSGRSPIPHLHFQCQRSPEIGAPTAYCEFSNYVEQDQEGKRFFFAGVPLEGKIIEEPEPNSTFRSSFHFPLGATLTFRTHINKKVNVETWSVETDLFAGTFLHEKKTGSKCYFSMDDHGFSLTDYLGPTSTGLYGFFVNASRIPFSYESDLCWDDIIPHKVYSRGLKGTFLDFFRPFFPFKETRVKKLFLPPKKTGNNGIIFGVRTGLTMGSKMNGVPLEGEVWFNPEKGPVSIRLAVKGEVVLIAERLENGSN
jgi:urea transporter/murein DD-endopeptidase MepM/ murein hydrolase activator NlpD